ncbi:unnamed protein product [Somion occarium]|uniref:F-box domain-containing protein n=1 Tax=Somion occarium TaxID=3059160 RepID=A0ABP1DFU7_9APHY
MDSEDERELAKDHWEDGLSGVEMRFHQRDQHDCRRSVVPIASHGLESKDDVPRTILSTIKSYRIMRFFETVEGFHTGSLDLTGRHQRRYDSIILRWNDFSSDLEELLRDAKSSLTPREIGVRDSKEVLETEMKPAAPQNWDQFLAKWLAHDSFSLHNFSAWRDRVIDCFTQNPTPRFQTLCLHDLPPELLHNIVEIAGIDLARKLGTTCRLLREISFSYMFKDHRFHLSCGIQWHHYHSLRSFDALATYLDPLITQARSKLLSDIDFVKSRPDILIALHNVYVDDEWQVHRTWTRTSVAGNDENRRSFCAPVYSGISNLIVCLPNLQSLTLQHWHITKELTQSLGCLERLRTLTLSSCTPTLRCPYTIAKLPSLLNFRLMYTKEQRGSWLFLGMCPNIKNLFILSPSCDRDEPGLIMPPPELMAAFTPFKTLQRFSMLQVPPGWIPRLNAWIQSARDGNESTVLRLTHFKLETSGGLHRQNLFTLLDVLNGSSIRFLVLDGLRYAAPDILDRIASALPQVEYLTLCYRESDIEYRTKETPWPFAAWEYAPHFANFTRLRRFSWNYKTNVDEYGPSALRFFEEGFPEEQQVGRRDADHLCEPESIAKRFSTFCPSLASIAFESPLGGIRKDVREDGQFPLVTNVSSETALSQMCNPLHMPWPSCTAAST